MILSHERKIVMDGFKQRKETLFKTVVPGANAVITLNSTPLKEKARWGSFPVVGELWQRTGKFCRGGWSV